MKSSHGRDKTNLRKAMVLLKKFSNDLFSILSDSLHTSETRCEQKVVGPLHRQTHVPVVSNKRNEKTSISLFRLLNEILRFALFQQTETKVNLQFHQFEHVYPYSKDVSAQSWIRAQKLQL